MDFKIIVKFKLSMVMAVIFGNLKVHSLPQTLKIGAIFSETQRYGATELAFKYAVYSINRDKGLLPETNLVYDIQYTNELDSFHACEKVCKQISYGVQAIFGPSNSLISSHIHSICDALDLPHLEAHIDTDNEVGSREEFAINLHPYQTYINDAFMDAIYYLNWTKVGILHEKYYDYKHI
ncbi:hypothetical protein FF38_03815 [Lucilia cuprina]|uniref:Receptor ligand binding region domain-containing protein n=1 Tax=Lucilia cuprina TaxID=7375 RepID=A0A0L0BNQ6_LUCCU|nr:kainate 1, Glutamate receptor ionotropic [Lucilia cuprina]KNC21720.1 hypothetical protein FF38_03815 [Lucilia cuprina]